MNKAKSAILSLSIIFILSACSIEPWVKPYEKAHLADEIMLLDPDPVSSSYLGHVHDSREGSRGAGIAAGGGCGCN